MKKETEKQREEMGAGGNPNVGWTNEEGGETDFPKHKIQRWWKVPTSFKSVNMLLCWHSNRTSDIFISQSLRWYQRIPQRKHPGNQIEDGINSKNNMREKKQRSWRLKQWNQCQMTDWHIYFSLLTLLSTTSANRTHISSPLHVTLQLHVYLYYIIATCLSWLCSLNPKTVIKPLSEDNVWG